MGAKDIDLFVVGSVSDDQLTNAAGQTHQTMGGAGLYAALGAAAAGATVRISGLISDDLPPEAVAVLPIDTTTLVRVPGRRVHFDISYDIAEHATYRTDEADAEELITQQTVLAAAGQVHAAHLCPTGCARTQADVAVALRDRGWWLSATTFGDRIRSQPRQVRRLISLLDVLVCSAADALLLTGAVSLPEALRALTPGQADGPRIVCVTDGSHGAHLLLSGRSPAAIPALPVNLIDPTGAGESFAGALAARLHHAGVSPATVTSAAEAAARIAATTVTGWGPQALIAQLASMPTTPHTAQPPGIGDMKLVGVEGIDNSGKTTLVAALSEPARPSNGDLWDGLRVERHQEPSDSPIGTLFRSLSTSEETTPMALALLSSAERHHQQRRLTQLEDAGVELVISDRYYLSGLAYHAVDGIMPEFYQRLNAHVRRPDLYLFLDVAPGIASARRSARPDGRWEADTIAPGVPAAYEYALDLVRRTEDATVIRLDAAQPAQDVRAQALHAITQHLKVGKRA